MRNELGFGSETKTLLPPTGISTSGAIKEVLAAARQTKTKLTPSSRIFSGRKTHELVSRSIK
jgi:hypothetical protein